MALLQLALTIKKKKRRNCVTLEDRGCTHFNGLRKSVLDYEGTFEELSSQDVGARLPWSPNEPRWFIAGGQNINSQGRSASAERLFDCITAAALLQINSPVLRQARKDSCDISPVAGIKNLKPLFARPHCASIQESKHDTERQRRNRFHRWGSENKINNLINLPGFCIIKAERDIF